VGTNRLEAFSDGVLSVAITLLVLNITVPILKPGQSLGHELARNWPHYAAYVTSFITIGIIWINHHAMVSRLERANHIVLVLNLLLLLTIAVLPFATSLMAAYLREPRGQHLAAGVYAGSFLAMSIAFGAMNSYILIGEHEMLATKMPPMQRRRILSRNLAGLGPYLVATVLAIVSAYATLVICGAIALFYALPLASGTNAKADDSNAKADDTDAKADDTDAEPTGTDAQ
jgi:uncharacterized membrane protein